ncbi:insulinase family protein [Streptomyces sp. NPDC002055]|uniref:M16 family metallopeptidase n=1 Tax=Streptomyces sp. NPDC002055 TaxID=3154534 RepID=UPI0033250DD3
MPVLSRPPAGGPALITVDRPGAPLAAVRLHVAVGSADEPPGERGLAHVVEHLVVRCAMDGGRVGNGALVSARTGRERTSYAVLVRRPDAPAAVAALAAAFDTLTVEPSVLATELAAIRRETAQRTADLRWRLQETLLAALWPGTSYAHSPLGDRTVLDALTPDAVRSFHAAWYRPSDATAVIVTDGASAVGAAAAGPWGGPVAGHGVPPRLIRSPRCDARPMSHGVCVELTPEGAGVPGPGASGRVGGSGRLGGPDRYGGSNRQGGSDRQGASGAAVRSAAANGTQRRRGGRAVGLAFAVDHPGNGPTLPSRQDLVHQAGRHPTHRARQELARRAVRAAGGLDLQLLELRGTTCVWAMVSAPDAGAARRALHTALWDARTRLLAADGELWLRTEALIPELRAADDLETLAERAAETGPAAWRDSPKGRYGPEGPYGPEAPYGPVAPERVTAAEVAAVLAEWERHVEAIQQVEPGTAGKDGR